ncbi:DUF6134 family protein [Methylocapsa palsarum]|nr:DUF6134 family protein [Methylocapsa palsarum]
MTKKDSAAVSFVSFAAVCSIIACGALAISVLAPRSSSAEPARPDAAIRADAPAATGKLHQVFDIIRSGDKIGVDTVDVDRQKDTTSVKTNTKLSVKVLSIEMYHMEHSANETWKGGQLVAFKSHTNDNGTKHDVEIAPGSAADKLTLIVDGVKTEVPKTISPASLWTREIINHPDLFDPADGRRLSVKVKDMGEETVTLDDGAKKQTHHYKLSDKSPGEFDRDVWYDGDLLVRMKLIGSDRSTIVSDLR